METSEIKRMLDNVNWTMKEQDFDCMVDDDPTKVGYRMADSNLAEHWKKYEFWTTDCKLYGFVTLS